MGADPYGYDHKLRRAALLPLAYGKRCPGKCGRIMTRGMALDLDHSVPLILGGTVGDRIICASCNRSAGATLGNRVRNGTHHSRDW